MFGKVFLEVATGDGRAAYNKGELMEKKRNGSHQPVRNEVAVISKQVASDGRIHQQVDKA